MTPQKQNTQHNTNNKYNNKHTHIHTKKTRPAATSAAEEEAQPDEPATSTANPGRETPQLCAPDRVVANLIQTKQKRGCPAMATELASMVIDNGINDDKSRYRQWQSLQERVKGTTRNGYRDS
jgi:hypothetical protein